MAKSSKSSGTKESKKGNKEKRTGFRKPLTRDLDVGKRLNRLRRTLGITQKEFGDRINMPSTSISSYERNLKNPLLNVLARIQKEFNANITWIVSGKGKIFVEAPQKLTRTQVLACACCDFGVIVPESEKHQFCPECSHALMRYCHQCGEGLAFANARFCSVCQVSLKKERFCQESP
jgi:transcriptional regulator with XRE-family HTH domain